MRLERAILLTFCVNGLVISGHGFPAVESDSFAQTVESLRTHLKDLTSRSSTAQTRQGPVAAAAGAVAAVAPNIFQSMFQTVATNAANRFFDELAKLTAPAFFQVVAGAFNGLVHMQQNFTNNMFDFNQELALADITEEMLTRNGDSAGQDDELIPAEIGDKIVFHEGPFFKEAVYKALDAAVLEMLKKLNPQQLVDNDDEAIPETAEAYFKG